MSAGNASPERLDLAITGMTCGHCVAGVTQALAELDGVTTERVAIGAASVMLDRNRASSAAVIEAIRDAGYDAHVTGAA